jgi:hypothetical protein
MPQALELKDQAARLLVLAISATEQGEMIFADLLTQRAAELIDQAAHLEERAQPESAV